MRKNDGRKLDHKTLEELRKRAVERVQAGESPEDVVRTLGFARRSIYNWLAAYRAGGWGALKAKAIPGRPRIISGKQMERLYGLIAGRTPQQYRFEFALWTLRLIRWLIYEEFGVKLSRASVARLLNQLGLSCQKPLFRASEQSPALVARWKREEYPKIQALAKELGAQIWFGDEGGVRSDYHTGTTWAPRGKTPVVKTTGSRYRYNMLSAISPRGDLRFMITKKALTGGLFVEFLKRLLTGTTTPIFLIVDGHPTHRSRPVQQYVASRNGQLRIFFLPPYSPELNPDEQVWNNVKNHGVGRHALTGDQQLRSLLFSALRSLQKLPEKVRAFFQLPDTRYILASA